MTKLEVSGYYVNSLPKIFMKINTSGNIKLVSLLFILGSSSAVLLIPAVIQKENSIQQAQSIKGNFDARIQEETNPIVTTIETINKEYIEIPVERVLETTKVITKVISEPLIDTKPSGDFLSQTINMSNPLNYILGETTKVETQPASTTNEPMIKVTKEMVDNCKLITDEYNKLSK